MTEAKTDTDTVSDTWLPKASDQQSEVGWTLSIEYLEKVRAEAAQACGYDATIEFTEQVLLIAERAALSRRTAAPPSGGVREQIAELVPDDADRADDTEQQMGFRNAIEQVLYLIDADRARSTLIEPAPATGGEGVDAAIADLYGGEIAERMKVPPEWRPVVVMIVRHAIEHALRRPIETDKGVRESALEEAAKIADYAVERATRDSRNPSAAAIFARAGEEIAEAIRALSSAALSASPLPQPVAAPAVSREGVIEEIAAERKRQVESEGWSPEHDNAHVRGEMAKAAACYALSAGGDPTTKFWPWDDEWWKPTNPRRDLVKAGALIVAEIERLDRRDLAQEGK